MSQRLSPIFPGMDPYLEDPRIWPSVHARFIVYLSDALQPLLRPRYFATVEERVFVDGPDRSVAPDVWLLRSRSPGGMATGVIEADEPEVQTIESLETRETYIEIRQHAGGQELVTLIELLSPTNKLSGPGHDSYLQKQAEVLASRTHLVEIDLLRLGSHTLAVPEWIPRRRGPYDYLVCVNRFGETRSRYEWYRRQLRDRLPRVRIPLAHGDDDVRADLQAVLATTYEKGCYRDRLRYEAPCVPPLSPEDQQWAIEWIERAARTPASEAG
ncbi:MAG TPA: DUF4058 family protein [Pirellulales bacterium]|nr:DUF4058 family protein [Pirellulales bacterium]